MKQLNLRLPDDIHAALTAMAEDDDRSLNKMVIALIRNEQEHRAKQQGSRRPPRP
jgi:predicted HicB family RNase H-like nuclease